MASRHGPRTKMDGLQLELDGLARTERVVSERVQGQFNFLRLQPQQLRVVCSKLLSVFGRKPLKNLLLLRARQHKVACGSPLLLVAHGLATERTGRLRVRTEAPHGTEAAEDVRAGRRRGGRPMDRLAQQIEAEAAGECLGYDFTVGQRCCRDCLGSDCWLVDGRASPWADVRAPVFLPAP